MWFIIPNSLQICTKKTTAYTPASPGSCPVFFFDFLSILPSIETRNWNEYIWTKLGSSGKRNYFDFEFLFRVMISSFDSEFRFRVWLWLLCDCKKIIGKNSLPGRPRKGFTPGYSTPIFLHFILLLSKIGYFMRKFTTYAINKCTSLICCNITKWYLNSIKGIHI